jgi:hypothetical protein
MYMTKPSRLDRYVHEAEFESDYGWFIYIRSERYRYV